jgi:hypothetical protein
VARPKINFQKRQIQVTAARVGRMWRMEGNINGSVTANS